MRNGLRLCQSERLGKEHEGHHKLEKQEIGVDGAEGGTNSMIEMRAEALVCQREDDCGPAATGDERRREGSISSQDRAWQQF